MTYPKATYCPKCGRPLKDECPKPKGHKCLDCNDGCVRANADHAFCRRCKRAQDAIYRATRKARVLSNTSKAQESEREGRERMKNFRPLRFGLFTFASLGADGVVVLYRKGDEDREEGTHLAPEQVKELRTWLEAR